MAYLKETGSFINAVDAHNPFHISFISLRFRDGIFNHFISRVQERLHIVICMSPVGDAFRSRCRMFPSLVNCCTIDWFTEWPR